MKHEQHEQHEHLALSALGAGYARNWPRSWEVGSSVGMKPIDSVDQDLSMSEMSEMSDMSVSKCFPGGFSSIEAMKGFAGGA